MDLNFYPQELALIDEVDGGWWAGHIGRPLSINLSTLTCRFRKMANSFPRRVDV